MAIWQFDFHVIPNSFLNSQYGNINEYSWNYKKINREDFENPNFLKLIKSDNNEAQWGDYDKTCINFLFRNNYLHEIFCRIDLRELDIDLLKKIVFYFQQIDGSILYGDRIYTLNGVTLKKLILSSNSFKFCTAPLDFFNELKDNKINL